MPESFKGWVIRTVVLAALCFSGAGCSSVERLFRNSPLSKAEVTADRVNVWPLYYKNGVQTAVLWPVFDDDDRGFALRPLITRDGSRWEVLPPLASWDAQGGDWTVLTAYRRGESHGFFPVYGVGDLSYAGPVWWKRDSDEEVQSYGIFPVARWTQDVSYVGPVWWGSHEEDEPAAFGLFPLFDFVGGGFNHVGPVFWGHEEDTATRYAAVFPLLGHVKSEDGSGMLLSLLGGRGWDEDGETVFLNVLGPVFHYDSGEDAESMVLLWPLFSSSSSPQRSEWSVWPLVSRSQQRDEEGDVSRTRTSAAMGLFQHVQTDKTEGLRMLPLFSHRSKDGGEQPLTDWLSLYGYKQHDDEGFSWHLGTPIGFQYSQSELGYRWSSLLGTVSYQSQGDTSDFRLLYYLYRQKTQGTETRRDFFPFISWDSGEERSSFSFLWRLFHWERNGDKVGGHVLFIPWGESPGG